MYNEIYGKKRKLLFLLSIFLIATMTINVINSVNAVDITINPNTPGGIAKALDSADSSDITVYLENGVYKVNNEWGISISFNYDTENNNFQNYVEHRNVNIIGKGSNVVIIGQGRKIFNIDDVSFHLKNVKIINSDYPIIIYTGTVSVTNCEFNNNYGAIHIINGDISSEKISVTNCTFKNNKYDAISGGNDKLSVTNCIFKNSAINFVSDGYVTIKNCTFSKNDRTSLALNGHGQKIVKKCKFIDNDVESMSVQGYVTIEDCIFANNTIKPYNVKPFIGLKVMGPSVIMLVDDGGSRTVINRCTFINNHGNLDEYRHRYGAILVWHPLKISNSKFINNTAGKIYKAMKKGKRVKLTKVNVTITPEDYTKFTGTTTSTKNLKILSSKASINGKNVVISMSLDKSKSKTGNTIVKLKTPTNIAYKSFKVNIGTVKYDKKTKTLTWTITNNVLAKKQATLKWDLKANKKGDYKVTPLISSTGNKIMNKKDIKFRIK